MTDVRPDIVILDAAFRSAVFSHEERGAWRRLRQRLLDGGPSVAEIVRRELERGQRDASTVGDDRP